MAREIASVAQLVEHHVANVIVAGSIPVTRSNFFVFFSGIWQNAAGSPPITSGGFPYFQEAPQGGISLPGGRTAG